MAALCVRAGVWRGLRHTGLIPVAKEIITMSPQQLLDAIDAGQCWTSRLPNDLSLDAAYQTALEVRRLRQARGEQPRGFKIGFTNRTIWPRYQVFAPIWGTVWNTTLQFCDGQAEVPLAPSCQPRIEPEVVFGLKRAPGPELSLQALFEAVDWIAPGFEVVQSHLPDWQFRAADTVADSGLHARLLVGPRQRVQAVAADATALVDRLAAMTVTLFQGQAPGEQQQDQGVGANVLSSPLHALLHFITELRQCPGAPDVQAGDVITTGTVTDAHAVQMGQHWRADYGGVLPSLALRFV